MGRNNGTSDAGAGAVTRGTQVAQEQSAQPGAHGNGSGAPASSWAQQSGVATSHRPTGAIHRTATSRHR